MTRKNMYLTPKSIQRKIKLKMIYNESKNDTKEVHTDDSDKKTENTALLSQEER